MQILSNPKKHKMSTWRPYLLASTPELLLPPTGRFRHGDRKQKLKTVLMHKDNTIYFQVDEKQPSFLDSLAA